MMSGTSRSRSWIDRELVDLDLQPEAGEWLHQVTGGWERALLPCLDLIRNADDPQQQLNSIVRSPRLIDGIVSRYLDTLSEVEQAALGTLAVLPLFDDAIASRLLGDSSRLEELDVALASADGGWYLTEPLRSRCQERNGPSSVEAWIIDSYLAHENHAAALQTHLAVGDMEHAAQVIAGLSASQVAAFDIAEINAAMLTLGSHALEHPRSLLMQARANLFAGRLADGRKALNRLERHLAINDPDRNDPLHLEVLCESGQWMVFEGEDEQARRVAEIAQRSISDDDGDRLQACLLDLTGLVACSDNSEEGLEQARSDLSGALEIWRKLGARREATVTGFRLVMNVLRTQGRNREALEVLDHLSNAGPLLPMFALRLQLYRSFMLPYVGRADEVAELVERIRSSAQAIDQTWIEYSAMWANAVAASALGETDRLCEIVDELEAEDAYQATELTTALMWVEVAEALARRGFAKRSEQLAERARASGAMPAYMSEYIRGSLDARHGDASDARKRLLEYLDGSDTEPRRRWSAHLLIAVCDVRSQSFDDARKHLLMSRNFAMETGAPRVLEHIEPELVAMLDSSLAASDSSMPSEPRPVQSVEIRLFDPFEVRVGDAPVRLPRGHVQTLIKMLAGAETILVVDQVIDVLWPEANLELGKRRLRNVVRRARESCGDIIERQGDTIGLSVDVVVDLESAIAAARRALVTKDPDEISEALSALRVSLLGADRYADWAEEVRVRRDGLITKLLQAQPG